jgi:hypothetical protein
MIDCETGQIHHMSSIPGVEEPTVIAGSVQRISNFSHEDRPYLADLCRRSSRQQALRQGGLSKQ